MDYLKFSSPLWYLPGDGTSAITDTLFVSTCGENPSYKSVSSSIPLNISTWADPALLTGIFLVVSNYFVLFN